ncbi:gp61 primase [Campylobacter phage vB_CcoM-IBB_35]|uniref:Gp61 primase n=1 Tax=Campylobacter virus IBB35 TaxID=1006972 RepID=H6SUF3_9CAUD|nr:toprim domain-containing protein [Campylobacter phage vB_CcoM-IBB_35]AEI88219.1 gp61 primase [Campylobacter phage vB_CcoM-IBB_35]
MLDFVDIKYFKLAVPGPYKESPLDIAVKCPICGDSKYKKSVKRLHLYEKQGVTLVHCFNGDCELNTQMGLSNFLKIYKPELLLSYKSENFKFKINSIDSNNNIETKNEVETMKSCFDSGASNTSNPSDSNESSNTSIESIASPASIESSNNEFKFINLTSVLDTNTSKQIEFLKSRGFNDDTISFLDFYNGTKSFNLNGVYYGIKDYLVIPFSKDSSYYGFYARSLTEKRFINFTLNQNYGVWNLFNVDLNKPVFIFEAILDALSFRQIYRTNQIIALNTSTIAKNVLDLIKYPFFCLDNDKVGIEKMIKYNSIQNSHFICYPNDLKQKDFNEMLQNNIKIELVFKKGFNALLYLKSLL